MFCQGKHIYRPTTACVFIRLFQLTHTPNVNNIVAEEFHKMLFVKKKRNEEQRNTVLQC